MSEAREEKRDGEPDQPQRPAAEIRPSGAPGISLVPGPPAVVHFGDLDLSRPADVQVLNSRIEKAAEATCNVADPHTTSLYYQRWHATCISHAVANTSARIAAVSGNKYRAFASK